MLARKKNLGLEADLSEYHKLRLTEGLGDLFETPHKLVVHDTLGRFLADVEPSANTALFKHIVGEKDRASRSNPVGTAKIPITELDAFEASLKAFYEKRATALGNAQRVIEHLRLPDPDLEPEMYRLYGPPWNRRLLVLWGCERKEAISLQPLAALAKLRRKFKPMWQIWLERLGWLGLLLLLLLTLAGLVDLGLGHIAITKAPLLPWWPQSLVDHIWPQIPNAKLQLDPNPTDAGSPVRADASASTHPDPKRKIEKLEIQWDTNAPFVRLDTSSKAHTFPSKGEYPVVLRVTDDSGKSGFTTNIAHVVTPQPFAPPPPPSGQYLKVEREPLNGFLPTRVTARVRFPGTVSFHGQHVRHLDTNTTASYEGFDKPGKYRIEWSPDASPQDLHGEFVDVSLWNTNQATNVPIANLQLKPNPTAVGIPVRSDASASSHPNPTRSITNREIQWGTNAPFVRLDTSSETHTFPSQGKYPVVLRVTDDLGRSSRDTNIAYVGVTPPSPTREDPPQPVKGKYLKVSIDPHNGLLPVRVTAKVEFPGEVAFHGQKVARLDTNTTASYDGFDKPGTYQIHWVPDTNTNSIGPETVEVALWKSTNQPQDRPIANLQLNPNPTDAGRPIRADASASSHPDPKRKIEKFEIQWGTKDPFVPLDTSSAAHTFRSQGKYPVVLRVTDDLGRSSRDTNIAYVAINPPSPPRSPFATLRVDGRDEQMRTVTVSDAGSTAANGSKLTRWRLDWGDKSKVADFDRKPEKQSHIYAETGRYDINLQCIDDKGAFAIASTNVTFSSEPKREFRSLEIVEGPGAGGVSTNANGQVVVEVVVFVRYSQEKNANLEVLKWRVDGQVHVSRNTQLTVQLPVGNHSIEVDAKVQGAQAELKASIAVQVTLEQKIQNKAGIKLKPLPDP